MTSPELLRALALLTPCEIDGIDKRRIGKAWGDGGYVMADVFRPGQVVYSYGISNEVSFDLALASRGLQVFMYDHTIEKSPRSHPNFRFFRQGVSWQDEPQQHLFTVATHVRGNAHLDTDMILKMDVEGAEWDVLDHMAPELLGRFQQCTFEFHSLVALARQDFRDRFVRVLTKLNSQFNLFHVHANVAGGVHLLQGVALPSLLEVSFLRKDIGWRKPWQTFVPSMLDASNVDGPDMVLSGYPFLPLGLSPEATADGLAEACKRAQRTQTSRVAEALLELRLEGRNIAPTGICSQSSLSRWSVGPNEAQRAVSAGRTGKFAFHTAEQHEPWWQVDLGHACRFDEIVCFNRLDAGTARASQLCIEVATDERQWTVLHRNAETFGGIDGFPLRLKCTGTEARFVRLRLPGTAALHLDAVEIYDSTGSPDRPVPAS
jgi:hypothetical protein